MKTRKNILKIIVMSILVLTLINFTGCSTKETVTEEDSYAEIKERGYAVMGLDDTFAPMGFKNDKGELVGFDIDLANEVSERIGFEIRFQPIDWTMKETELNSGNIDFIWNGYYITEERKEKVAFSEPYLENKQIIITLSDSDIDTKNGLKEKIVAVQNESSALDAINEEPEIVEVFEGGEPVLFDTNNEAFMDLEAGRVDAVVADEVLARYYIQQRGAEKYKILEENFGKEEYAIGMRKEDKELIEKINKALADIKEDGSYKKAYEKWFGN